LNFKIILNFKKRLNFQFNILSIIYNIQFNIFSLIYWVKKFNFFLFFPSKIVLKMNFQYFFKVFLPHLFQISHNIFSRERKSSDIHQGKKHPTTLLHTKKQEKKSHDRESKINKLILQKIVKNVTTSCKLHAFLYFTNIRLDCEREEELKRKFYAVFVQWKFTHEES